MNPTTSWQAKKAHALEAVDQAILTKRRAERASRKARREWMTRRGLKPTRAQAIYRVETNAINIPEWAEHRAIPGFSGEDDVVRVRKEHGQIKLRSTIAPPADCLALIPLKPARCPLCQAFGSSLNRRMLREREEAARLVESHSNHAVSGAIQLEHLARASVAHRNRTPPGAARLWFQLLGSPARERWSWNWDCNWSSAPLD